MSMSDRELLDEVDAENARLIAINAELVAALEWIEDHSNDPGVVRRARAAIAKAKGEAT